MAVRIQDGSGNALTSTANALDVNIKSSSGGIAVTGPVSVTGTFWQATQPVSLASLPLPIGAVASSQIPAALDGSGFLKVHEQGVANVSVQNATLAVTGTFWQATQPVSATILPLPTNAAEETGGNLATIASQMPAATAKGIQASVFGCIQQPKDSGRTTVVLSTPQAGVASVTAEALLSFNMMKGATQSTAQTSYTVAAGKTLRIQFIRFKARFTTPSTTVTFANVQFNVRNAAAIATTNLVFTVQIDCAANMSTPDVVIPIPDGWELPSGSVIAFSQLGSATTLTVSFEVKGYEY